MQRESSLRVAYDSLRDRWPGSFENFTEGCAGWEVHPVSLSGALIGAILVKGPEIHACIRSGFGRWFRKEQAAILNAVIDQHGYAHTHATTQAGREFVLRLGFTPYGNAFRRYERWGLKRS